MVEPGQQTDSRRPALGRVVHLRVADAALSKSVEIRRADLRSVASEIRVTHVVNQDDHDIGLFRSNCNGD